MEIQVGVSNRHVHLTIEHLKILFGEDFQLEKKKDISQIGQYASTSTVTLKTPKNIINNVRILGPTRDYTQVEISKTDAYFLGLNPPIRISGDLLGTSEITIVGPKGEITVESCIVVNRHIHINEEEASLLSLKNNEEVSVEILGKRGGRMDHVKVRVAPNSYFEMHVDTDEANAFFLTNGDLVNIIKKDN